MGGSNNWRVETNAADWMRGMEKRILHEERRPGPGNVIAFGPGIAATAVELFDWNSPATAFNGFWFSMPGAINAPTLTDEFIGQTIMDPNGNGMQIAYQVEDPTIAYTRTVEKMNGLTQWGSWELLGGGSGGGGGTPTGPAGGDLTGTYPNPQIAPGAIGSAEIIDGSITADDLDPATVNSLMVDVADEGSTVVTNTNLLNFAGGLIAATPNGTGGATITVTNPPSTAVDAYDEGTLVRNTIRRIDFVGGGVTTTPDGGTGVVVTIPGVEIDPSVVDAESVGVVKAWAGMDLTKPEGYLLCNGDTFSSVSYPDLAAILGDKYGTHVGTTYYLPDLRDRIPIGANEATVEDAPGKTEQPPLAAGAARMTAQGHAHTHGATGLGTDTTGSGHTHGITNVAAGDLGGSASVGGGNHGHSAAAMTTTANSRDMADTGSGVTVSTDAHLHTINDTSGGHGHSGTIATGGHNHSASSDMTGAGHVHGVTGSTANDGTGRHPFQAINYIIKARRTGGAGGGGTAASWSGFAPALPAGVWTNIVHSLGTEDVVVACRDVALKEGVDIDWKVVDLDTIALRHLNGVAANVIRVVVK